ncbi:hypothetical protein [Persicitalea jodogahamensis]|uniref:Uncharacterized protein n=1 Tax=Persicitalea jodogahamensis TaxID=402147 RepID=A0A8J3GAK4_9BACT|nr:hypothetical protein [Persicitalea jodogahamensis]GHB80837.1 hypothetical protein GCM10007390_39280 [Persicitalea jodogahamensis]
MKKTLLSLLLACCCLIQALAQKTDNFISATIDGQEWKAEAKRLKVPFRKKDFNYLALAGFEVNPDVQLWIRLYYFTDELKPGTFPIEDLSEMEKRKYKPKSEGGLFALVDYTEETKKMGHGFHDGESLKGTVTITAATPTSVEGTFEGTLNGVYYQKRVLATMTGSGLRANLGKKMLTGAGAGMAANFDPHEHDNTKKTSETDTIKISNGKFKVDWSKDEN